MESRSHIRQSKGFTLIELIGVLAVIATLSALILPEVFALIAQARIQALATATKNYEKAIHVYYEDIGSILPLNDVGTPEKESGGKSEDEKSLAARLTLSSSDPLVLTTGRWPVFRGPYLEHFDTDRPPGLGTKIYLPTEVAIDYKTLVDDANLGWDLKGDDGLSDIPSGAHVAFLKLEGFSLNDFLFLDAILEPDIGSTQAEKILRGRAKYKIGGETLHLYLAHR